MTGDKSIDKSLDKIIKDFDGRDIIVAKTNDQNESYLTLDQVALALGVGRTYSRWKQKRFIDVRYSENNGIPEGCGQVRGSSWLVYGARD